MKKTILTSIGAIMLSVATAGATENCKNCNQSNYKIFFGINAGMHGWNYASDFKILTETALPLFTSGNVKIEFPKTETIFGLDGGVRFGKHSSVWNGGFTISANMTLGKKPDITAPEKFWNRTLSEAQSDGQIPAFLAAQAIKDLKFHTNIISASFDNYIRLNKSRENRLDLVAGVGIADIETNVNLFGVGLSLNAHAALLKAGLELELTDNIAMTIGADMYIPVSSQLYASQYDFKGGFKFSF